MINFIVGSIDRVLFTRVTRFLMYHGFCPDDCDPFNDGKHVAVSEFEKQLQYLRKNFSPVSLTQFLLSTKGKYKLPSNSIVLTFDDGFSSNYKWAYPLLQKYNVPATIYLTTDFILKKKLPWTDSIDLFFRINWDESIRKKAGNLIGLADGLGNSKKKQFVNQFKHILKQKKERERVVLVKKLFELSEKEIGDYSIPAIRQPLEPASIKEMALSGLVEFGAHSKTHPILSQCDDTMLRDEIIESINGVESLTGQKCIHFAYPNGRQRDFDSRAVELLQSAGIQTAVTTIHGENNRSTDRFCLKRVGVYDGLLLSQFKKNLQPSRRYLAIARKMITGKTV